MTTPRRNRLRVTAVPLMVLAVLFFVPGHRAVGSAHPAGTAKGGGTILFERQNHWYTIAPNGTHLHMLLPTTAGCPDFGCAAFSPDGTRIMLTAQSANKKRGATAIINTSGSGYHVLPLPDRTLNLTPGAWAPNGTRIALHGWDDAKKGRTGIYAVNASNGGGMVRLTTSPDGHDDDPLAYSPDGSRLLFGHDEGEQLQGGPTLANLFETSARGSGRIKLNPRGTSVTPDFGSPASWSPDGKQIAFTAFSPPASSGESAVFVEDANGTHLRRITPWGQWSTTAHWSPSGTWIVFDKVDSSSAAGYHDLFLVHPNGTGLKAITSTTSLGSVIAAVWSPDGTKLLFGALGYLRTKDANGPGLVRLTKEDASHETAEYAWGR